MKTVALRFITEELEDLVVAYEQFIEDVPQYRQREDGLELLQLWIKLQDAARDAGSYMVEESNLPKWARTKLREALATAGKVRSLQEKVADLETRAKARGVTAAAQAPSVTKARKKPAHKAKPARKVTVDAPQPAPVT